MDTHPDDFERQAWHKGYSKIAGVDEAGRGPLAGPVVAAAAILPPELSLPDLDDSKKLSPGRREEIFEVLYEEAISIGIGIVDPAEIDRINILQASLLSMRIAVDNLQPAPDYLLVDGLFPIGSPLPQRAIKFGDRLCRTIAAASIIAKVTRDRLMGFYDKEFPEFGFYENKGYGTEAHRNALLLHGYCRIHRKSFRGVREHVKGLGSLRLL